MNKTLKRRHNKKRNNKRKSKRSLSRKKERKNKKHVTFNIKGGNINPVSYTEIDKNYYYPLNNQNNSPLNPNTIIDGRNVSIKGGKTRRKIKGGNFFATSSLVNNPFTNIGSFSGAITGANIITGTTLHPNPDPIIQPSYYTYNEYRPPLA